MPTDFSVLYFGYGALAQAAVRSLVAAGARLAGIVVPSNRSGPDVECVRALAEAHRVPLLCQPPRKELAKFENAIRALAPDLLVVWSYTMILPESVIQLARRAAVNVHGGLLPEYRGGHVMQWAIINGERETGVTLHHIDRGIDTGPIIAQSRFAIEPDDDAASVRDKIMQHGARLLETWIVPIARGTAPCIAQDESRARYHRLRTAQDGEIDWAQPAVKIRNLIRALVPPWPGAYAWLNGRKIILLRARVVAGQPVGLVPGAISRVDAKTLCVVTGDGILAVEEFCFAADQSGFVPAQRDLVKAGEIFATMPAAA